MVDLAGPPTATGQGTGLLEWVEGVKTALEDQKKDFGCGCWWGWAQITQQDQNLGLGT